MSTILPFAVGTASTDANLAPQLGTLYFSAGKGYRLCKAGAAIAAAASKVLVTAVSSGVPTWSVNTTTAALNTLVAGVVPVGQVDSAGAAGLLSADYFLLQVSGPGKVLTHTDAVALGSGLATSTTAGSADVISATYTAIHPGQIFASLTEATSGVDTASDCRIFGLV